MFTVRKLQKRKRKKDLDDDDDDDVDDSDENDVGSAGSNDEAGSKSGSNAVSDDEDQNGSDAQEEGALGRGARGRAKVRKLHALCYLNGSDLGFRNEQKRRQRNKSERKTENKRISPSLAFICYVWTYRPVFLLYQLVIMLCYDICDA